VDVSYKQLERAKQKLNLDRLPPLQRKRIDLIQGSLNYADKRIQGFDAVALVEVIEHLDVSRLSTLEYVVFGDAKPKLAVITTPNAEYNARFEELESGTFRHKDHRFEWTRMEFQTWAAKVADRYGYSVSFQIIGPVDENLGGPTQMAIFTKK
jgi:3' terminal RNA ribose 2'-O-methyltransferase Hen1